MRDPRIKPTGLDYTRTPPRDTLCAECWRHGKQVPKRPIPCQICITRNSPTYKFPTNSDGLEVVHFL